MRRGYLFRTGQVSALAGLLWTPCIGIVEAAPRTDDQHGVVDPIDALWNEAWGHDFALGQSGMLLWSETAPSTWLVLATDLNIRGRIVGAGGFAEAIRLPVDDSLTEDEIGGLSIAIDEEQPVVIDEERSVVAGLLTGSTGAEVATYGIAILLVLPGETPDDPPVTVHSFAPLGVTVNVDEAVAEALVIAAYAQNVGPAPVDVDSFQLLTCGEQEGLCRQIAYLKHKSELKKCGAAAIICVSACALGCGATTIAYPLCLAACGAACLTVLALCNSSAGDWLEAEYIRCQLERAECEDG